jgi:hypothetical protein
MRSHGDPSFYFTSQTGTPSPPADGAVMDVDGYAVDVDPSSPPFEAAEKACQHLAPFSFGPPRASHQQFLNELKSVECMRSHGYPNWPEPPHGLLVHVLPVGIDFSSPQYQSAAKACGEPAGPPGG